MAYKEESLLDLIQQAKEMLLDRSKEEQDLIYHIAKFPDDLRTAIVIAYRGIYDEP